PESREATENRIDLPCLAARFPRGSPGFSPSTRFSRGTRQASDFPAAINSSRLSALPCGLVGELLLRDSRGRLLIRSTGSERCQPSVGGGFLGVYPRSKGAVDQVQIVAPSQAGRQQCFAGCQGISLFLAGAVRLVPAKGQLPVGVSRWGGADGVDL